MAAWNDEPSRPALSQHACDADLGRRPRLVCLRAFGPEEASIRRWHSGAPTVRLYISLGQRPSPDYSRIGEFLRLLEHLSCWKESNLSTPEGREDDYTVCLAVVIRFLRSPGHRDRAVGGPDL